MEELLSFLTGLLLALSIYQWAFTIVADLLLNQLFVTKLILVTVLRIHYAMHG